MGSKLFRKKLTALILAVICLLSLSGCQAARKPDYSVAFTATSLSSMGRVLFA